MQTASLDVVVIVKSKGLLLENVLLYVETTPVLSYSKKFPTVNAYVST